MSRLSLIVACLLATAFVATCSQVSAIGFFSNDRTPLEPVHKAELDALNKDAEEFSKISDKYLAVAQNLLKPQEQTDDTFIGLGGKCIVVSHKLRYIEHMRRKVIEQAFRGPTSIEDLRADLASAHWRAYAAIESTLTEIAMMGNSPPKVNFLPELLHLEQLLVARMQQAEKDHHDALSQQRATARPRSASIP
jgi:hypothetical protein